MSIPHLPALVTVLALLLFFWTLAVVGRARGRYGIKAPATTGDPAFERVFRVQMNTLELLVVFVPAILTFAHYVSARWAAGLGAVYVVGRVIYLMSYVKNPASRGAGFGLSMLPIMAMVIGTLLVAVQKVFGG